MEIVIVKGVQITKSHIDQILKYYFLNIILPPKPHPSISQHPPKSCFHWSLITTRFIYIRSFSFPNLKKSKIYKNLKN